MKRRFNFLFLVLYFVSSSVNAQESETTFEISLSKVKSLTDSAQYNEALLLSRQVYTDFLSTPDQTDTLLAKIYNSKSTIFFHILELDSSIYYSNMTLALIEEESFERSIAYNTLGKCHHQMAQFEKAITSFDNGLEIIKHRFGENHFEATKYYGNLSLCYNATGRPQKAIQYLKKNLNILLDLYKEDHIYVAKTYNNLGAVYYNMGDYNKALEYNFKTIPIKERLLGDRHPSVASSYVNIGSLYKQTGELEKSKIYAQKGLNLLKESLGDTHPFLTYPYKVLGNCSAFSNNNQEAIDYYKKGIKIIQKVYGENHFRAAGMYYDLSAIFSKMKNYDKAIFNANKALKIFVDNNGKNNKDVAACNEMIGTIYFMEKKYDKAIDYYKEALEFYSYRVLKAPDAAKPNLRIANAYTHKKNYTKANSYFNESAKSIHYDFNRPLDFDKVSNLIVLRNLLDKKRTYFNFQLQDFKAQNFVDSMKLNDQYAIALEDHFQNQLSENEVRSFHLSDVYWRYENAINTLLQDPKSEDLLTAFNIAEKCKSRLLYESFVSTRAQKIAGISNELLDEEYQINIDLAFIDKKLFHEKNENETPNDSLLEVYNSTLFSLKQKKDKLIQNLKKEYPSYYKLKYDKNVVNVSEIQKMLSTDQALLQYFVGDSSVFIFVISKDKYTVKRIEKNFPLEEWVYILRESIYSFWMQDGLEDENYRQNNKAYVKAAVSIYQKLVAPVYNLLPKKIIIVPDGALNFIPFECLLTETPKYHNDFRSHNYLIKQHQISYNYSATLYNELSNIKKKNHDLPLLAVAPSFNQKEIKTPNLSMIRNGFGALKYNVSEAKAVHKLLGGDLLLGAQATGLQFSKNASKYQILHLSTHGKSNDLNGDYSFVAFSNMADSLTSDRLYVRDLYNMKLNADMVVLSACETGLGEIKKGEGIIGLARGFTYAGAASTVTSLWSVNDIQTTNLMTRFYKNIKAGMAKDAALREAKLSYINEENHVDPYFWSAFIAAGNTDPIKFQKQIPWWPFGLFSALIIVLILVFKPMNPSESSS